MSDDTMPRPPGCLCMWEQGEPDDLNDSNDFEVIP